MILLSTVSASDVRPRIVRMLGRSLCITTGTPPGCVAPSLSSVIRFGAFGFLLIITIKLGMLVRTFTTATDTVGTLVVVVVSLVAVITLVVVVTLVVVPLVVVPLVIIITLV